MIDPEELHLAELAGEQLQQHLLRDHGYEPEDIAPWSPEDVQYHLDNPEQFGHEKGWAPPTADEIAEWEHHNIHDLGGGSIENLGQNPGVVESQLRDAVQQVKIRDLPPTNPAAVQQIQDARANKMGQLDSSNGVDAIKRLLGKDRGYTNPVMPATNIGYSNPTMPGASIGFAAHPELLGPQSDRYTNPTREPGPIVEGMTARKGYTDENEDAIRMKRLQLTMEAIARLNAERPYRPEAGGPLGPLGDKINNPDKWGATMKRNQPYPENEPFEPSDPNSTVIIPGTGVPVSINPQAAEPGPTVVSAAAMRRRLF